MMCCYSTSDTDLLINMDSTSIGEISNFNGSTNNGLDETLPVSTSCSTSYTKSEKELSAHPNDTSIALSVHRPLYPPGKMIHIVRTHSDDNSIKNNNTQPSKWRKIVKKRDPVIYKALYVDNTDFNEILITPVMINDHMPNRIMDALQKLVSSNAQQKIQRCKTISNGGYSNIGRFSDNHYESDLASRPLLSYQYSSNWSNDTLDHASTIRTIAVQPTRQNQYEYPEMDLRPKNGSHKIGQLSRQKKQNSKSINEIIRKMKKIDLSTDEWIGKAPLATPETSSETSSICSRSITTNDLNSSARRNSLKTVSEGVPKTTGDDSVAIQIDNEPTDNLNKVDVTLNIDVNALFDQLEKQSPNASRLTSNRSDKIDDQLNRKFVKRTSSLKDHSLKRNDSTSSSSKRVTFDPTTVVNTGETLLINKPLPCRRANSERISRRKMFSTGNSSKNQKLKQIRQLPIKLKDQEIKDRDQVDNELNEKLEELLSSTSHSFSYSDTDLNRPDDDETKIDRRTEEADSNTETIQVYVHSDKQGNEQHTKLEYSPVKQILSPIDDYPIKIATNMNLVVQQMSRSNESSPKKASSTFRTLENDDLVNDLYDKEQYERLFQKLSTIESPTIDEDRANCDKKFKSDLNKINE